MMDEYMDELLEIWELAESMGLPEDANFWMTTAELASSLCAVDVATEKYLYTDTERALLMIELCKGSSFSKACEILSLETDFVEAPEPGSEEEAMQLQRIHDRAPKVVTDE